jgi:DNA-binding response OmpR family regulator
MAKILVIEDDEQIRSLIKQILEKEGHYILIAPEGEKGLALYKDELPDLVITDIVMPGKEGLSTIMDLKSINPNVKIIAISGGGKVSPESYLYLAEKYGAMAVLKKPFTRLEITNSVNRLLD